MNVNQLITMVLRMVLRKAVNRGINAGIDHIAKGKGGAKSPPQSKAQAQQTKRAIRMTRRAGRL